MRWLTVCLTCHLVLCSVVGLCAEPEKTSEAKAVRNAEVSGVFVREAGPPVYYLKNQNGQLVPMLGFEYEDFMELLRQEQRASSRPRPAPFTIDQVDIRGMVEDRRANLDTKLTVTTRRDGSIRVPIGLSQAIMREDLKYQGAGSAFLDYDAKQKEYVIWIEGEKGQKHELSLSVTIPIATIGLDTRLRFDAPRSTRSRMTLVIPDNELEVHVPIESRLTTFENKKAQQPQTRLTIDSVRGDFQLLWHKSPSDSSNVRTVMEASGEIVVNVGSLDITCEAILKVQGRGMPIDRFRIRLPKGTETYQVSDGDYQVIEVEDPDATNGSGGEKTTGPETRSNGNAETVTKRNRRSRMIEVRLTDPTLKPVVLQLSTKRPLDRISLDSIEPAGFEVIDAVRQSGHVVAVVGPDYFVSWSPERGIRRVDKMPDTMHVKNPSVVFEYYSAPFLLKSRIEPRRTWAGVEPEHIVHVGADQLRLDSTFRYTIRGKEVLSLELDLGNWELDKIGPETLVDANRNVIFQKGLVTVPLLQPIIGHIRLEIEAHRAAPQKETKLKITFPCPRADSLGPAVVVIQPDDNVKLLPDAAASTGLSRLQAAPPLPLPERQQVPLYYRGNAGQATFSAERSIHEQQISVDLQSIVVFEERMARMEQWFTYQIDHEQSDRIVLAVPEAVVHATDLEFLVDGIPVVPQVSEKTPSGTDKESFRTVPVALVLKSPRIGQCMVTVRYSLPLRALTSHTPTQRRIPFVLPSKEPILRHELSIITPLGLMVDVLEDRLERSPVVEEAGEILPEDDLPRIEPIVDGMISKADFAAGMRQNFNITGRLGAVMVSVSTEKRCQTPSLTIHRAFLQTWVTDREYHHRALFQIQTEQEQIELTMPSGQIDKQVDFSLDGKPLSFESLGDHRYLIPLPENRHGRQRLELRWASRPAGKNRSILTLGMPQLGKDAWIQRWYWQLILPPDRHLIRTPKEVLLESSWKWDGGLFHREPLLESGALEDWVGAPTPTPETTPSANFYLFSSFGTPKEIQFRVANRSFMVLVASGLVLTIGFFLIYIPAAHHPAGLLALAVVLGSMGVIYSELMLLGLQASALGVVLVGVAMILKRHLSRPKLPRPIAESGGSSILNRGSTQRQVVLPPVVGHPQTTETQFKPLE